MGFASRHGGGARRVQGRFPSREVLRRRGLPDGDAGKVREERGGVRSCRVALGRSERGLSGLRHVSEDVRGRWRWRGGVFVQWPGFDLAPRRHVAEDINGAGGDTQRGVRWGVGWDAGVDWI